MDIENTQERVAALQESIKASDGVTDTLKKVHTAVLGTALAKRSTQVATLVAAEKKLVEIQASAPTTTRKHLIVMRNEIASLREGVDAGLVGPQDLILESTKPALLALVRVKMEAAQKLEAIGYGHTDHSADWEKVIQNNSKFKSALTKAEQQLDKLGFGFARVPVSLSFVRNMRNKHSSVGFLNRELLTDLGFKNDMIGGYAVIYGQVVLAVNPKDAYVSVEQTDDSGSVVRTLKQKTSTERVVKYTKDVGSIVDKKRPMQALDIAKQYKKLLEKKTNQNYSFVSEKPYGHKGVTYFWLMPDRDLSRFAKAFPGKHVGMDTWGFAF